MEVRELTCDGGQVTFSTPAQQSPNEHAHHLQQGGIRNGRRHGHPRERIAGTTTAAAVAERRRSCRHHRARIDPGDEGNYNPDIDPADFVTGVDNPYFPLPRSVPGGSDDGNDDGEEEHIEVTVTDERKEVLGIAVVVVRDTVEIDGEWPRTRGHWYAEDREGQRLGIRRGDRRVRGGRGHVTEGSWEAGVDGALPLGIVMPAAPEVGDAYRQEFYEGEAEDLGEILQGGRHRFGGRGGIRPAGGHPKTETCSIPMWSRRSSYAEGIGVVLEEKVQGGEGRIELTEFSPQAEARNRRRRRPVQLVEDRPGRSRRSGRSAGDDPSL